MNMDAKILKKKNLHKPNHKLVKKKIHVQVGTVPRTMVLKIGCHWHHLGELLKIQKPMLHPTPLTFNSGIHYMNRLKWEGKSPQWKQI